MEIYTDTLKADLALSLAGTDMTVLDVGAGQGTVTVALASLCRRVIGIDADLECVRDVNTKLRNLPAGEVIHADAQKLPFPAASFDLVFCYSTLVIMPDDRCAIAEIHRVLRPNGRAVIDIKSIRNANSRHWQKYYTELGSPFHSYTWKEARIFLNEAGFSIDRVYACGWSRGHLYLPLLRGKPWITRMLHSGHKPDADYILSNIWPLSRFASQWFFVVSKLY
jgi:SAM-dependent methyltransferase